jgi:spore coat protein U-like protein
VSITCTKGANVHIALNQGIHYASNSNNMQGGSDSSLLPYGLYKNEHGVGPWGDDPNWFAPTPSVNNAKRDFTVYGLIPAAQVVSPGTNYADTVTATVYF